MMDRRRLEQNLEAFALDQLDAETHREFERSLADHPDLTARAAELHRTLATIGRMEEAPTPSHLRAGLLGAALDRRAEGSPVDAEPAADASSVYREVLADSLALVDDLDRDEMAATTIYRIPVVEMVSHIGGTESYLADRLGLVPHPGRIGHHVDVRDDGADLTRPDEVVDRWRRMAAMVETRVMAMDPEDLAATIEFHGLSLTAADVLIGRGFELWTHVEDICRATGRPLRPPSGPVLRTMADGAMTLLRFLLTLDGRHHHRSLRITLTGAGGGSWRWVIGTDGEQPAGHPGPADATVVDDVSHFCRLIAARVEPELPGHGMSGDRAILRTLLELAPSQADFGTGPVADPGRPAQEKRRN